MEQGGRPCRMQGVYGWGALPNAALNCSAYDLLLLPELPSFLNCSEVECSFPSLTTEAPSTTPPDQSTVTGPTTSTLLTTTSTLLTTTDTLLTTTDTLLTTTDTLLTTTDTLLTITDTLLTTTNSTIRPTDGGPAVALAVSVTAASLITVIIVVLLYRRFQRQRKERMVVLTKGAENDGATTPSCGANSMSQPEQELQDKLLACEEESKVEIANPGFGIGSKENWVGSGSGDASDVCYDGDPVTKNTSL